MRNFVPNYTYFVMIKRSILLLSWAVAALGLVACHGEGDTEDEELLAPVVTPVDDSEALPGNPQGHGGAMLPGTDIEIPSSFENVLLNVQSSTTYQPETFAQALANSPMLNFFGDNQSTMAMVAVPLFRLTVNSRVPQMDELFSGLVGTGKDGKRQWQIERYVFTYKTISSLTGADTVLVGTVTFPNNTLAGVKHEVGTLSLYHHVACFDETWLPSVSPSLMTLHALHNSAVIEPDQMGGSSNIMQLVAGYINGDILALQMLHCIMAALDVMKQHGVALAADGYTNNWGLSLGMPSTLGFAQYMENDAPDEIKNTLRMRATYTGEGITSFAHLNFGEEDAGDQEQTSSNVTRGGDYKYNDNWHPKLPLWMSCCPNDNFVSYKALKSYCMNLRTNADGSVNEKVKWIDFNVANTEYQEQIGGNHFVAAILTLFYMSCAENPADMEEILQ